MYHVHNNPFIMHPAHNNFEPKFFFPEPLAITHASINPMNRLKFVTECDSRFSARGAGFSGRGQWTGGWGCPGPLLGYVPGPVPKKHEKKTNTTGYRKHRIPDQFPHLDKALTQRDPREECLKTPLPLADPRART
jgi:hypothetical protein